MIVLLCLLTLAGALSAQPAVEAPEGLRGQVEARFQALALEDGVALVPLASLNGVRSVELRGERVLVNGAPVSEEVLRSWLQVAAPPVIALSKLPAGRQRALFGFSTASPQASVPPVVETPVLPPPSAEPGVELSTEQPALTPPVAETQDSPRVIVQGAADDGSEIVLEAGPEPERRVERRTRSSGTRTAFGRSLVIQADEVAEEAVSIGGSLTIDGEVTDSALAVGGPVRVRGRVLGDVAAIGGEVYLEENSEVQGDVVTVGGSVHREPGAQVFGEISDVALDLGNLDFNFDFGDLFDSDGWSWRGPFPFRDSWLFGDLSEAMGSFAGLIFMALLVGLVALLANGSIEKVSRVAAAEPWKAGLIGLVVSFVLLPVVILVLVITIIGCLVVPLVLLAAFVIALVGYSAVALHLGKAVSRRFDWTLANAFLTAAVGVALLRGWSVLGDIFALGGWPLFLPAITLAFFGFMVNFAAWSVGIGAVLISAWDRPAPTPMPPRSTAPLPPLPVGAAPLGPPPAEGELPELPSEAELEREFHDSLEDEAGEEIEARPPDDEDPERPD